MWVVKGANEAEVLVILEAEMIFYRSFQGRLIVGIGEQLSMQFDGSSMTVQAIGNSSSALAK